MTSIGVAVTTYNRPQRLDRTLAAIREYTPDCRLIVVDDGSTNLDEVTAVANKHEAILHPMPANKGISAAKNECLNQLHGCEHVFLFDDDTRPTAPDWWKPYVDSPEPHLMYQFPTAPSHWALTETYRDENLVAYNKARGCMMYIQANVVDTIGGFHNAFGKHGGEHEDFSLRAHEAGLTTHPFADIPNPSIECDDETEKSISSVDYRESKWWRLIDRTRLPAYADYTPKPTIPVLVPRRADNGHRDLLWNTVQSDYWRHLDWLRIVEGESPDGPFNRAAAINTAARHAGNWSVAVIADGDAWVPLHNLNEAIRLALATGKLVSALDHVVELNKDATENFLNAGFPSFDASNPERVRSDDLSTQSLMVVVPRPLFEAVGGFDERFVGWGGEDNAFWRACELVAGTPERIPGPAYHLWHPTGAPQNKASDPLYRRNWGLWVKYRSARTLDDVK